MSITRNFNLFLNAGRSIPLVINANQYDQGEQWVFTLYESDGTQYTPSSGSIVGIKSDGYTIANAGTVNGSGQVVITETEQMTAAAGKAVFELQIDSDTHGTANFIVMVEESPLENGTLSDSDISMFQGLLDIAPSNTGTTGQVLTRTADGAEWASGGGGGGSVTVDTAISTSSTNPVQNAVIASAIGGAFKGRNLLDNGLPHSNYNLSEGTGSPYAWSVSAISAVNYIFTKGTSIDIYCPNASIPSSSAVAQLSKYYLYGGALYADGIGGAEIANLIGGMPVVLSFDVQSSHTVSLLARLRITFTDGTSAVSAFSETLSIASSSSWATQTVTGTIPDDWQSLIAGDNVNNVYLMFQISTNASTESDSNDLDVLLRNIKLEYGTTATDYSWSFNDLAKFKGTGTTDKITVSGTSATQELTANKFYVFGEVTALTITLATPADSTVVNEYHFRFTSGSTATTLTLPNSVTMPTDFAVEASKVYEISIVDGYGTVTSW